MASNRVFVIQEATVMRDYSSALRYGEVLFLLDAKMRSSRQPAQALAELREKLKDFRPTDFILWSAGDYLSPILAGIVLGEKKMKHFNWLKWERTRSTHRESSSDEGYYVPVRVPVMVENLQK